MDPRIREDDVHFGILQCLGKFREMMAVRAELQRVVLVILVILVIPFTHGEIH